MSRVVSTVLWIALCALVAVVQGCQTSPNSDTSWKKQFAARLPVMGHRNFIVVADAAYPEQSAPGVTTIYTGQGQIDTVQDVLTAIDEAPHVNGLVYLDAELASVSESDAPGISEYRQQLARMLDQRPVQRLPHMTLIEKLADTGAQFNVLILKTDLTLPYTSVFIELDCGYWDAARENRLRESLSE